MRQILNGIISRLKKEPYQLNEDIPVTYLFFTSWYRLAMIMRGLLVFCRKDGLFFLGAKTVIKCTSKISLGSSVTIERGCYFDALSRNGIRIGKSSSFGKNCIVECTGNLKFLGKGLHIGNHVGVGSGSFLGCAGGIEIGDDTIIGNYVTFHSENHNYSDQEMPIRLQGVNHQGIKVGKNCWIGAKVTILDGVTVEDGCVIAAGALLTKGTYLRDSIYGGVPAKFIRKRI
ncbi:acyltransferase [Paraflavisolibacter sp. H34]|uniref:acyltransferase n=1 Tax=Huijunlia imazamoxiresistens TaxID=3127457 RepID=UPI0030178436